MRQRTLLNLSLALGLLSAGYGLGFRESAAPDPADLARQVSQGVHQVADRVSPAVVQVRTLGRRGSRTRTLQDGSGVIVRPEGIVLTNQHVVQGGTEFRVVLTTGRRMNATLVGRDQETDLAVLRIVGEAGETFPALQLLEERVPRVGETVLALGNPMGLGHSVTSGIVSGLGRSDLDITTYEDFIQTDATINPGNSGGPLVNLEGRVVGINTAVGLASNGDDGIAFAIPAGMARKVLEDILEHGEVVRGWLGVEVSWYFDPEQERGFDGVSRLKVTKFPDVSPAKDAGLELGDIILSLDGKPLVTRKDLLTAVAELPPSKEVPVCVWRSGQERTLRVRLAQREAQED